MMLVAPPWDLLVAKRACSQCFFTVVFVIGKVFLWEAFQAVLTFLLNKVTLIVQMMFDVHPKQFLGATVIP
jgi:hypothetical protein